jgi:hypothetical protein
MEQKLEDAVCKLILDSKEYNVGNFNVILNKPVDEKCRPIPGKEELQISVNLAQYPDNNILEWGTKPNILKNGSLWSQTGPNKPVLEVEFENAGCALGLDYNRPEGLFISFVIVPERVTIQGVKSQKLNIR